MWGETKLSFTPKRMPIILNEKEQEMAVEKRGAEWESVRQIEDDLGITPGLLNK